jgi:transposase
MKKVKRNINSEDKDQIIAQLSAALTASQAALIASQAELAAAQVKIEVLTVQVQELIRKLGLNSTTSSKPPSSDGFNKPPPVHTRQRTGKKRGGQNGHKGKTLEQVASPTSIILHEVKSCRACGSDLTKYKTEKLIKRQEFDVY